MPDNAATLTLEAIGNLAIKYNARVTIYPDGLHLSMPSIERRIDQMISYLDLFDSHVGPVKLVEDWLNFMSAMIANDELYRAFIYPLGSPS